MEDADSKLEQLSRSAGEQVGSIAAELIRSTTSSVKSGREYVKENPISSLALAAAAGLVLGGLLVLAVSSRDAD